MPPRPAGQPAPATDDAFVQAILEREAVTDHDVAAFVDVVQAAIGAAGVVVDPLRPDVVRRRRHRAVLADDRCRRPADRGVGRAARHAGRLADEHRDTVMIGRTHGVHAEPTTFGAKVALWALQVDRDRTRLRAARDNVAVMKLSGAVGTYSNIPPAVERFVGDALGLRPVAGHPGDRPRPPQRVPVRVRIDRRDVRADGGRAPPPAAHRGARGAGGLQAGPEGLVGDAAQAEPDLGRDDLGSGPGAARRICRPACRTWRSGTSATSRTRRSSGSCCPTRRSWRTT